MVKMIVVVNKRLAVVLILQLKLSYLSGIEKDGGIDVILVEWSK